jgi:hypothetical protein
MMTTKRRLARNALICLLAGFVLFAAGVYTGASFIDVFTKSNQTLDAVARFGLDLATLNRLRDGKTDEAIAILTADMEGHAITLMYLEANSAVDPQYEAQKRRLLGALRKDLAEHPRAKLTLPDAEADANFQAVRKQLQAFLDRHQ